MRFSIRKSRGEGFLVTFSHRYQGVKLLPSLPYLKRIVFSIERNCCARLMGFDIAQNKCIPRTNEEMITPIEKSHNSVLVLPGVSRFLVSYSIPDKEAHTNYEVLRKPIQSKMTLQFRYIGPCK